VLKVAYVFLDQRGGERRDVVIGAHLGRSDCGMEHLGRCVCAEQGRLRTAIDVPQRQYRLQALLVRYGFQCGFEPCEPGRLGVDSGDRVARVDEPVHEHDQEDAVVVRVITSNERKPWVVCWASVVVDSATKSAGSPG
jgi:hypothetical protein